MGYRVDLMKRLLGIIVLISTIVLSGTGCYNKISNEKDIEIITQKDTIKNEAQKVTDTIENNIIEGTDILEEDIKQPQIVNYQVFINQNDCIFEVYEHDSLYNPANIDYIKIIFDDYIEDDVLVSAITEYKLDFSVIHDNNETILQLQNLNSDIESIQILKEFAKSNDQLLVNDINISFNGNKPEFKLFRLDNNTLKHQSNYPYLTTSNVMVEIDFMQEMNKTTVETAIINNIRGDANTTIPRIDYNWENDRNVIVSLNDIKIGDSIKIDLTGSRDIDNDIILGLYDSNKNDVGGMFTTDNIIYEFHVSGCDYLGIYTYKNNEVKKLYELADESYWIGNISNANNWVLLGMADEWLFHMSIFNIQSKKRYFIGDEISVGSIEDAYIDDKYAVFCSENKLKYICLKSITSNDIVIQESILLDKLVCKVLAFNKTPDNDYSCIVKGKEGIFLVILDSMMNSINTFNLPIDVNNNIYGDFYWLDDHILGLNVEDKEGKSTTYFFNLNTNEVIDEYQNSRIVSCDNTLHRIIIFDQGANIFNVLNTKLDLINSFILPGEFYYRLYSDLVIWNNINEFLIIQDKEYIVSFNIHNKETNLYNIEEHNFSILKGVGNNQLLITNTQRIQNEEPFNW